MWVLPVPLGPSAMTFSRRSTHSQRASSSTCILFRAGIALKSKLSRLLTAGNFAALTHARAVVDLCRLAGQPQMAGRFLERDTGIDDVRAALLATRAEAVPDISAAHPQPGRPSGARPWGDVIARTFRLKG